MFTLILCSACFVAGFVFCLLFSSANPKVSKYITEKVKSLKK